MHRDPVGSSPDEILEVGVRGFDHQMNVHREVGGFIHRINYEGADGDVRDESAVHNVNVNPICTCFFHSSNILGKTSEVRREDRWGDESQQLSPWRGSGVPSEYVVFWYPLNRVLIIPKKPLYPFSPPDEDFIGHTKEEPRFNNARPPGQLGLKSCRIIDPMWEAAIQYKIPVIGAHGRAFRPYP